MSFIISQDNNNEAINTSLLINEFHLPDPSSIKNAVGTSSIECEIETAQFLNAIAQNFSDNSAANEVRQTILGTDEDDVLNGENGNNLIFGKKENDLVIGREGSDTIYGGKNDDTLRGQIGHDLLSGDDGNDLIFGNQGSDFARGGDGKDSIYGGQDNDLLLGEDEDDRLFGEQGNDLVFGNQGNDTIRGDSGNDILYGGQGNDVMLGGDGDDCLHGDNGNDFSFGGQGNDRLSGGDGDDLLNGGQGDDFINGGQGNDLIIGDRGNDFLTGGLGKDTFRLEFFATSPEDTLSAISQDNQFLGVDTIADFNPGEERIELDSRLFPAFDDTLRATFSKVDNIDELVVQNAAIIYESSTGSVYYNPTENVGDEVEILKFDPNLDNLGSDNFSSF